MPKTAYHINEVLKLMDKARDEGSTVNLKAWTSEGEVIDYSGWMVKGGSWRGGETVTAYSYEGSEPDGSIKIEANSASYNDFVAGLVRTKYSQNDVEAILCNHGDGDSAHDAEYLAFQEWREKAKEIAQEVLKRAIA